MADPFVGEIRAFPFAFAPVGWATCEGQLLPISQNTALFSLLGTTYGGDGRTTFALPDLRGAAPMHPGQGPGLSLYALGEQGGSEAVTLTVTEIPAHTHAWTASQSEGGDTSPVGEQFAVGVGGINSYAAGPASVPLSPSASGSVGGSQPHENRQPYLPVTFCIALQGVFPPRS